MRFHTLAVFAMITSTALAAQKPAELSFQVKNERDIFLRDVARLCLSSPEAKIEAVGPQMKLIETNDLCAREIRSFAEQWDAKPEQRTLAIHARPEQKVDLEKRVREKFPEELSIHVGAACPCILFRGKNAREASEFALK
jgi:hypothetical protein